MKKYRHKPIEVEAVQFYAEKSQNKAFQVKSPMFMSWPVKYDKRGNPFIMIQTDGGELKCSQGDWIIKGLSGEYSICKSDVFERSFTEAGAK